MWGYSCGKSQYLSALHDAAYGLQPLSCTLQPSGVLGYTGLLLELEFEVMGLNWAVGLPGHFAGTFAGMYIFGWTSILVDLVWFPVWVSCSERAYIGYHSEAFCVFDSCFCELVHTLDYFTPVALESIRSSIASIVAANPERDDTNIGRYALCRQRLKWKADYISGLPHLLGVYNIEGALTDWLEELKKICVWEVLGDCVFLMLPSLGCVLTAVIFKVSPV